MTPERKNAHLAGRYTIAGALIAGTFAVTVATINKNAAAKQAEASLPASVESNQPDTSKPIGSDRNTIIDPPEDGPFVKNVKITPTKFGKNGGIARIEATVTDPHKVLHVKLIVTNSLSPNKEVELSNGGSGSTYSVEYAFEPLSKHESTQYYRLQLESTCANQIIPQTAVVPSVTVENK